MQPNEIDTINQHIDKLFDQMFGLFPASYSLFKNSSFKEISEAKEHWVYGLRLTGIINGDNVLNEDLFYKGMLRLPYLNQQLMPSLGQFAYLCTELKI